MTRLLMVCSIFFLIESQQSNTRLYAAQGLMYIGALSIIFIVPHIPTQDTSTNLVEIITGITLFGTGSYLRMYR